MTFRHQTNGKIIIAKTGETFPEIRELHGDFEQWISRKMTLHRRSLSISMADPRLSGDLPDLDEVSGIVITGSHAMVTDDFPWLTKLSQWVQQAHARQIPMLGICFGHQILARSLGGEVAKRPTGAEVGTVEVTLTEAGREDSIFDAVSTRFPAQLVHWQSVTKLPSESIVLAKSALEPYQSFKLGSCTWGVQFHPEISGAVLAAYLERFGGQLTEEGHDLSALKASVVDTSESAKVLQNFAHYVAARS